jgi:group I intron endonuclease
MNINMLLNKISMRDVKVLHVFDNLDQPAVRFNISNTLKNKAGIYLIINKKDYNFYIGSAITNRLYARFTDHLVNSHLKKGSSLIRRALLNYNINDFIFTVIDIYPEYVDGLNRDALLQLETSYLGKYMPTYNILYDATRSFSPESRISLSAM